MPHGFELPLLFTLCVGRAGFAIGTAGVDRAFFLGAVEHGFGHHLGGEGQHGIARLCGHLFAGVRFGERGRGELGYGVGGSGDAV